MADFLTKQERSALMSRIRSKNTTIEKKIIREIRASKIYFRTHDRSLPGCPDLVFRTKKIVVFLDGGFWHGYKFKKWGHKLKPFWRAKIVTNMRRDRKNRKALRANGWKVMKFWQHEIQRDPYWIALLILDAYASASN